MPAVVVVPRWGGSADSDWYPWLRRQLATEPATTVEVVALRPHPDAPRIAPSVDSLGRAIDDAADRVVLVGHSVGCQVVVRCLASRGAASAVAAVLVAGWFSVDEPWPEIQPWIETRHGLGRVPVPTRVLLSTDDPFTADHAATRAAWQALGADVSVHHGAGHFNAPEEPVVRDAVRHALRAI